MTPRESVTGADSDELLNDNEEKLEAARAVEASDQVARQSFEGALPRRTFGRRPLVTAGGRQTLYSCNYA